MQIFEISKQFPPEEKYSLTDQIRRSSRSVCICLLEAYRKKLYPAHFVSKVTDSDMENSETSGWLDFSLACNYITNEQFTSLIAQNEEIGKLLNHMIINPDKYDYQHFNSIISNSRCKLPVAYCQLAFFLYLCAS